MNYLVWIGTFSVLFFLAYFTNIFNELLTYFLWVAFALFLFAWIISPYALNQKIHEFQAAKSAYENRIGFSESERYAIVLSIIESNKWLEREKYTAQTLLFGVFYHGKGRTKLLNLKPIGEK